MSGSTTPTMPVPTSERSGLEAMQDAIRRSRVMGDGTIVIWQAGAHGGLDLSCDLLVTGDWRAICHQPKAGKAIVVSGQRTAAEAAAAAVDVFLNGVPS